MKSLIALIAFSVLFQTAVAGADVSDSTGATNSDSADPDSKSSSDAGEAEGPGRESRSDSGSGDRESGKAVIESDAAERGTDRGDQDPESNRGDRDPESNRGGGESGADRADPPDRGSESDELDRELLKDLVPDLQLDTGSSGGKHDGEGKAGGSEVQDGAGGSNSPVPLPDELDHAVGAMRQVSQRLVEKDVSEEVTAMQDGIVRNIDALIERLQNTPPPSSSQNSPDQSDQSQSDSPSKPESNPQRQKQQQRQQKSQQQSSGQQQGEKQSGASPASSMPQPQQGKAADSSEQNEREARERATALARRRALIDEVWGHLPETVRERLLNVGSEKLLPKYEQLIRRYYKSLAEPERNEEVFP